MKRREFLKLLAGGAAAATLGLPLVDAVVTPSVPQIPVGTIFVKYCDDGIEHVCFDGRTWIPCDGRTVSRERYPELFAVLGTLYGGSDEAFTVPDLRGG